MSYNCEILADSLSPQGERLASMKITFPRIMLAEFNTHRMFTRNSASSRAIPFNKMVKMVEENPFTPIAWQIEHSGMQGTEYKTGNSEIQLCTNKWLESRDNAVKSATLLNHSDIVTKQLCNRLLEPFMWHTVIITSGKEGLDNFFELRCPNYQLEEKNDFDEIVKIHTFRSKKDVLKEGNWYSCELKKFTSDFTDLDWLKINKSQADIHIQAIAELMWDSYNESIPKQLKAGEWHIPYGDNFDLVEIAKLPLSLNSINTSVSLMKVKIAVARCARISYETLGDNPKINYEADIKLHDMLLKSKHFSPFEHVARAMSSDEYYSFFNGENNVSDEDDFNIYTDTSKLNNGFGWCRNFKGFIQYRALIDNNGNSN